jgi:ankyrin repeat protein
LSIYDTASFINFLIILTIFSTHGQKQCASKTARGAQLYQGTSYKDARLPFSWAASNGYQEVVKVLLKAGVDPTIQETTSGRRALSWAVGTGQEEVVKLLLLDKKSDLTTEGKYDRDRTVLSRAAESSHKGIAKLLLEHGGAVDGQDVLTDRTPVAWAAAKRHKAVIQLLFDKGAALESVSK